MRALTGSLLLGLLLAGSTLAQDWNPIGFPLPDAVKAVRPTQPVRPVRPVRPVSATSPQRRASPATRAPSTRPTPRSNPASPVGPVYPVGPTFPQGPFNMGNFSGSGTGPQGTDSQGVGTRSDDNTMPPPGGVNPALPVAFQPVVLKRLNSSGFEIFEGASLGQMEIKGFAIKAPFGNLQFNPVIFLAPSRTKLDDKRGLYQKTRRGATWQFSKSEGSRSATPNKLLFELRPKDEGFDVYSRANQRFARIRWEKRKEGGKDVVQRVYYHRSLTGNTAQASIIRGVSDDSPALILRLGAGEGAQPKVMFILEGWEAGPSGGSKQQGLSFGGLGFGGFGSRKSSSSGSSAAERNRLAILIDGLALDVSMPPMGWRSVVGILSSFEFYPAQ